MGEAATSPEARLPAGSVPAGPVLDLAVGTVVIADLHLAPLGDARTAAFERDCAALAGVPRLVILGDLFDVWVGRRQERLEGAVRVRDALAALTRSGTEVDLVPGNRDALLDRHFAESCGASFHREGFVGRTPDGRRSACVHGDALCTQDHGYQRLRRTLRSPFVRALARWVPLAVARRIGARVRAESEARKPGKLGHEKSIRTAAVVELATRVDASVVVCGHAHVHRDDDLDGVRWIVVGAWREGACDRLSVRRDGSIAITQSDA